jgi:hypothetical protein
MAKINVEFVGSHSFQTTPAVPGVGGKPGTPGKRIQVAHGHVGEFEEAELKTLVKGVDFVTPPREKKDLKK